MNKLLSAAISLGLCVVITVLGYLLINWISPGTLRWEYAWATILGAVLLQWPLGLLKRWISNRRTKISRTNEE